MPRFCIGTLSSRPDARLAAAPWIVHRNIIEPLLPREHRHMFAATQHERSEDTPDMVGGPNVTLRGPVSERALAGCGPAVDERRIREGVRPQTPQSLPAICAE